MEARNRFHRLLLQCSNAGAWQEALHVFGAMVAASVPPTRETIHFVIRSCGRARPAQPALAVAMTQKMNSMGIASTEKTYHLTMAASSAGGNHRMLAAAFVISLLLGTCQPQQHMITFLVYVEAVTFQQMSHHSCMKVFELQEFLKKLLSQVRPCVCKKGK